MMLGFLLARAGVTNGAAGAPAAGATGAPAPGAAPAPAPAPAADVPAGSGITSVADVRAGAAAPVTLCSQRPTDEAMARLRRAWERCYVEHAAQSGAGGASPYHVRTESAAGRQTLVLRGAQDSIVAIADFSTTTQCATRIVARGATPAFNRAAENTGVWLRDPNAPSLDSTCR